MTLEQVLERIPPLDAEAMAQAKQHWDALAKPLHGLGDLEDILIRIAGICRTPRIDLRNKAVVVMCADNGVVAEGISQSGQDVTQIITENLSKGHVHRLPYGTRSRCGRHSGGYRRGERHSRQRRCASQDCPRHAQFCQTAGDVARPSRAGRLTSALRPPCCAGSTAMTSLRPAKWASATRPRRRLSPQRCCMRR